MNKTKNGQRGFGIVSILIIVFVVAMLGATAYYVYHKNRTKVVTTTSVKTGSGSSSENGISSNVSVTAPVAQTESCGDEGCFDKQFAACKPATLTAGLGEDIKTATVAVYYKITGPQGGGCNMLFRYTKNPNPEWVDKDLTCNWDNKIALQASIEQTFNNLDKYSCTGALTAILKG